MDLHTVLPDFPTADYAPTIATLEKAEITVKELLLLDALEVAKQTQAPVTDVRRLAGDILDALHKDLGVHRYQENEDDAELLFNEEVDDKRNVEQALPPRLSNQLSISTLDSVLDAALAGGIRTGYVTEIAGESGCGKTQLLLHLLLAVQLPPPHGLSRGALYISTEGELPTSRLAQLLSDHPLLSSLPDDSPRPSFENILSITTIDLESQDHILYFQVPVAVERHNIGLVVVDSITANYRAELSVENPESLIARARELKVLGHFLRDLAAKHNIVVIVANQVSDQFGTYEDPMWTEAVDEVPDDGNEDPPLGQKCKPLPLFYGQVNGLQSSQTPKAGPPLLPLARNDEAPSLALDLPNLDTILALDYQKPFFTGWGDPYMCSIGCTQPDVKAPALGLVWTNQIACRIILRLSARTLVLSPSEAHEKKPSEAYKIPPSPIPLLVVPDSDDSDDGIGCDETLRTDNRHDAAISVGPDRKLRHMQNVVEESGTSTRPSDVNNPTATLTSKSPNQPTSTSEDDPFTGLTVSSRRRTRVMEVVFSPWTSGSPRQSQHKDADDDGWEDIDEDNETDSGAFVSKLELSAEHAVEFEILPSGIRSVT